MAKDFYHEAVKRALEKDGWKITHDPYPLRIGRIGYEVDLGAEKLMAAERQGTKIAVEVKSFMGPSDINEFHRAMGQFNDYYVALELFEPDRVLYLAIPEALWEDFFQEVAIQKAIQRMQAKLIIYQPKNQKITRWIS